MRLGIPWLWAVVCSSLITGCQSGPNGVNPQFGSQTMTLVGAIKFDSGAEPVVADALIRYEDPNKYELLVTKDDQTTYCKVSVDKDRWSVEFPGEKRRASGNGATGEEDIGLWVTSSKVIEMAIKQAQFTDDFTQTMKGEYKSGRLYEIELSDFRKVVGQVMAMRMRLTCKGCKSSLEIAIRGMK